MVHIPAQDRNRPWGRRQRPGPLSMALSREIEVVTMSSATWTLPSRSGHNLLWTCLVFCPGKAELLGQDSRGGGGGGEVAWRTMAASRE